MDTTKTTTHIGLCAGYGGIELGLKRVIPNLRSVALCEIEAFACANLVAKMEAGLMEPAPIWTDLKTFPWESFRDRVDILTGGYPCQPFSAAGKRLGTEDPRHLWPYIASGIRILRPKLCFFENVEGHISLGLREVIGELESMGYKVSWGIFSASEVGAPHQRKRVFILADRKCAGLEGLDKWDTSSEQTELVGADFGSSCQRSAWPSRPGEPQHAWEPPRVVGGSVANSNSNEPSEGRGDNAEVLEVSSEQWKDNGSIISGGEGELNGEEVLGNASAAGLQGCGTSSEMDNQSRGTEGEGSESTPPIAISSNAHGREVVGNAILHGHATSEIGRGTSQSEVEGRLQESEGGSASMADNLRGRLPHTTNEQRNSGTDDHAVIRTRTSESGGRQTQPSLGRDADGPAGWMDYAELYTSCDNRTDELRLLGNGVVPATAERAFRTLLSELNT